MSRLLIEGTLNGTPWDNIYAVSWNQREFDSLETILIHNGVNINDVDFFGRYPGSPVPDKGSTMLMLGLAICTLTGLYVGLVVIGKT
jgi:hypothetical protein